LAAKEVDCKDMSAVVFMFTRAVGGNSVKIRAVIGPFKPFIVTPIGWNRFIDVEEEWYGHQFVWFNGTVYDACVKLGGNPTIPIGIELEPTYKNKLMMPWLDTYWKPQPPFVITVFY